MWDISEVSSKCLETYVEIETKNCSKLWMIGESHNNTFKLFSTRRKYRGSSKPAI